MLTRLFVIEKATSVVLKAEFRLDWIRGNTPVSHPVDILKHSSLS